MWENLKIASDRNDIDIQVYRIRNLDLPDVNPNVSHLKIVEDVERDEEENKYVIVNEYGIRIPFILTIRLDTEIIVIIIVTWHVNMNVKKYIIQMFHQSDCIPFLDVWT